MNQNALTFSNRIFNAEKRTIFVLNLQKMTERTILHKIETNLTQKIRRKNYNFRKIVKYLSK